MTSQLPNLETEIEFENPCLRPASITTSGSQIDPQEYFYTAEGTTFNVNSIVIDPPVCAITYECLTVTGSDSGVKCEDKDSITFSTKTGRLYF